ncbi:MAG TPA: DUF1684 domain-containing protein [Gemmatimonadales bacterium]|nr:DUF1684 domain-containing protein [Gemmatimonadales bacterium]
MLNRLSQAWRAAPGLQPSLGMIGAVLVVTGAALPFAAVAQTAAQVAQERREFGSWIRTAPVSPLRAVVVRGIETGLTVGPASADIPLAGVGAGRISERDGRVTLVLGDRSLSLVRDRPAVVGAWRMVVNGPPGRSVVTVYAAAPAKDQQPLYYPYDPTVVFAVALTPAREARNQRLLAPDGVEVEATDAGTIDVSLGGVAATLRVMRLPGATEDESELEIYFRDATSDHGSYPAGRFVSLIPKSGGGYSLDFNRARNPFCAYNTVYPCPAPWRGNLLTQPVKAGERYAGGGLDKPPS